MYFLLGLVGHPVSHSLSPPMHKAALAHYGLAGDYRLIDLTAENLDEGVLQLVRERFVGFNVTVPHKLKVIDLVGDLTGEARQLKAVNTVRINSSGVMTGHNTDLGGSMVALSEALPEGNCRRRALVVGAGGAARAAVWGLVHLGWQSIEVVARKPGAAQTLVDEVTSGLAQQIGTTPNISSSGMEGTEVARDFDLLVNCSPIGLENDVIPDWIGALVPRLAPHGLLFDMVYRRSKEATPLVRLAQSYEKGATDGVGMLVHQAALAFNYWTGKAGPVDVMAGCI